MNLKETKDRIIAEKLYGDTQKAAEIAGVTNASVFRHAMRCDNFDELTPDQIRVLSAMIDILDKRIEDRKKLTGE